GVLHQLVTPIQWVMMSDTVDYGEWCNGKRLTGISFAGTLFVLTRLNAGGLNPKATFSIEQISPSVAILDSDDGMGHCALIKATD
ncbi:hypothetical protein MJN51_39100, partial [Salmonella enterica subsp. enterica serovar Kentucky]|nr:hypothetical protein [Salmonella enterica subsp. enterica serovar Kentucky]